MCFVAKGSGKKGAFQAWIKRLTAKKTKSKGKKKHLSSGNVKC
jgi:hypothetical protein